MKPFTVIAIVVLAFIAVVHLHRLFAGWGVTVGGFAIPMWSSAVAVVVFAGLAWMLWREARSS